MADKSLSRRPLIIPGGGFTSTPTRTPQRRSRTPEEAIADGFVAIGQVHALRGVTRYGMETLAEVDRRRVEIAAELPEVNELLAGLEVNCARLIAGIQNALVGDGSKTVIL